MNELCIDAAYKSLNKYGEKILNDFIHLLIACLQNYFHLYF